MITQEELKEVLSYDPLTGVFIWIKPTGNRVREGSTAGNVDENCVNITIKGKRYKAHHLAWLWCKGVLPSSDLDHENGNPLDNRIDNLRPCTTSQNAMNTKMYTTNTSGVKGVSWIPSRQRWKVQIEKDGKPHFGGRFVELADAALAAAILREKLHGEYCNHG